MKLKISLATSIKSQDSLGLGVTPMLLLCKLSGHGLGSQIQTFDQSVGGIISQYIEQENFRGDRGEHFVLDLDQEGAPDHVMVVGLGSPDKVDSKAITQLVDLAVENAVARGCSKLSIPILPNRAAQGINLRGQAHLIKVAAEKKIATYGKKAGELEIELVCAPQAKAHLSKGLSCKRMGANGTCCDDNDAASGRGEARGRNLQTAEAHK